MNFQITHKSSDTLARRGVLKTPHGNINTPVFMPVGTRATVKAMTPAELLEMDTEIILGNTYHLFLKPGTELIKKAGGLHGFSSWPKPLLTDSGGFQVFSLASLRKIRKDGVEFSSHVDGTRFFMGPKESIGIQRDLNSDIVMAFDECTPFPCEYAEAEKSMLLTTEWEAISREQKLNDGQQIFGIVQGSVYRELREKSAQDIVKLDFDGYAIGGLSVGEPEANMYECIEWVMPFLPENKPHYLMGVGMPWQIVEAVARGIDMFDCVIPTRLARHGSAFVSSGECIPIKAGRYKDDLSPVDENCCCYSCSNFSKAYIRHLLNVGEMLGIRLLTIHNLYFYLNLMKEIRFTIENGTFSDLRKRFNKGEKTS